MRFQHPTTGGQLGNRSLRNPVRDTKSPARNRMTSLLTRSADTIDTGEMDSEAYATCSLLRLAHWAKHNKHDTLGMRAKFCAPVLLFQKSRVNGATRALSHPKELGRDYCA